MHARAADSLAQTLLGDFTGTKLSVVDVAVRLSQSRVPVGIEVVNGPEGNSVDLVLKGVSVADVLDAAVRADPRYQWKESGGVIDLLPRDNADPVFEVIIHHFEATNEPAMQMINQLVATPELKKYLVARNMQADTLVAGSFMTPPKSGSLIANNETLRQALNDVLSRLDLFTGLGSMISRRERNTFCFKCGNRCEA